MRKIHYYNQKSEHKTAKLPAACVNKSFRFTLDPDYFGDGFRLIFTDYFTGIKLGTKVLKNSKYGIYIK